MTSLYIILSIEQCINNICVIIIIGNERWMNGTWATSRSVPLGLPTLLQEKLDLSTSVKYNSLTLDISSLSSGDIDFSYGTEDLPAICEYGKLMLVHTPIQPNI